MPARTTCKHCEADLSAYDLSKLYALCRTCRKSALSKLEPEPKVRTIYGNSQFRGADAKENILETKKGDF